MTLVLKKFQADNLHRVHRVYHGRAIIGDDMGLGKGVQAIAYMDRHIHGPVLIICPKSLKENWRREIKLHIGRRSTILDGKRPHLSKIPSGDHIWIINYDILGIPGRSKKCWSDLFIELSPDLVVIDEGHKIKHWTSQRSKACKAICVKGEVPSVLILSGTPATSRPIELWFLTHIVKPNLFPSRLTYGMFFCDGTVKYGSYDFQGSSNTKELHKQLTADTGCMVRHRKEDVLLELPPRTISIIPMELTKSGRRDYDEAVDDFIVWLAKRDPRKAARAALAEEIARMGYLKRLAAEHKLPMVESWIEDFLEGSGEKLLVFGLHKAVLRPLHETFKDQAVLVDGSITGALRQEAFDRFNRDPKCKLFFGNMEAAGVGWSCTSTSNVAAIELDWVPGVMEQAFDRVRGISRGVVGKPANVYILVAENTIESDLCDRLQHKSDVLAAVLDGRDMGSMRLFDQLKETLIKNNRAVPKRRRIRR